MTFNEKLKQALAENHNERMYRRTITEKKHKFSLAYRIWERRMLKNLRSGRPAPVWSLRKVKRVVTISFFVAAVTFILTAGAVVGITLGRFSFNDKSKYSDLFMSNLSSDKTRFEEYYGLPEEDGWIIVYQDTNDITIFTNYERGDKKITLEQTIITGNMGTVNTENAVVEPMSLYKEDDGFFIALQGDSDCVLYWTYNGYLLNVSGNLNKSELVNLAYSTKIVDLR